MPSRRISSGERPPIDLPRKLIWPELGLSTPVIAHSVVDLPAPLWPTSADQLAFVDLERELVDGGDPPVVDGDVS